MHALKYLLSLGLIISTFSVFGQVKQTAIKVEIKKENGQWQLLRGGEPYYIKGIGGTGYLDEAAAYGANSIRIWSPDGAKEILDEAHKRGMTVLMGLWVNQERQGFDYNDGKSVKAQFEGFRQVVKEYKDHPAVLMWAIGNECDLFYSDFKVWNAINDIAKMVHEEDPNHPTMTVTAGMDIAEAQLIQERAPHIDVYGINTYAHIIGIGKTLRAAGWNRPYVITEWGPNGHWEVPKTAWGAAIEQTSSEKAVSYKERYEKGILADEEMCIGSYVFLWGQKQETTSTWYGLFLEDGTETEVMDVLEYHWTSNWPKNRAPNIASYTLNGKTAYESPYVKPGGICKALVEASDPGGDPLEYVWEIVPESTDIKSGGDAESKPQAVPMKAMKMENGMLQFRAPIKEGPYRLFLYIYDGNGNAATANLPFYVRRES